MQTKPSKFWAYIAVIVGGFLTFAGLAALIGYLGMPIFLPYEDALSYDLGRIATIYLGLICGPFAIYHGLGSIMGNSSNPFKLPAFYIFWIVLALVLGIGSLILNFEIATDLIFPMLFVLGAALSVFAVLAWSYRKMGWPLTWRQTALAFICGSTLSVFVAILFETTIPYIAYLLLDPFQYMASGIADLGWGAPGFIEKLFASPLIFVFLVVTGMEAPIPEEFAKALGIPMFGRARIQNERQAFAIGLASGAGFAILENMLYEGLYASHNGWSWGGITLLRSIGAVLHPLGTGIIALGWFRMKDRGIGTLLKAYLLSVGLHTLWNGGFEPLVYLTGLDYLADEGSSLSIYGETLNILLIGYLILLSAGLWWLLRRITNQISERIVPDLLPDSVSKKAIAVWAVACTFVIIPIGATLSPAWSTIQNLVVDGHIEPVETITLGTVEQANKAFDHGINELNDLSNTQPDFSEITQPGDVFIYEITFNKSQTALWSYEWCATTQEILDQNLKNINLMFVANGTTISEDKIAKKDFNSGGRFCREYFTVITQWPRGRHQLDIQVNFAQPINDGWNAYPAGAHYYKYTVIVKR